MAEWQAVAGHLPTDYAKPAFDGSPLPLSSRTTGHNPVKDA